MAENVSNEGLNAKTGATSLIDAPPDNRLDCRSIIDNLERVPQQSPELGPLLETTVTELGDLLGLDRCVIDLFDGAAYQYWSIGSEPLSEVELCELRALSAAGSILVPDGSSGSGNWFKSLLCLPIIVEEQPAATLAMATLCSSRDWGIEELALSKAVVDKVALAIRQDRLFRRLHESAREAEALYKASNLLVDTTDIDHLYEQILDAVADVFGHPNSSIWLVDQASQTAALGYTRGTPPPEFLRLMDINGPGLIPYSIRSGQIINAPDVSKDDRYVTGPPGTRAELVVPLRVRGSIVSVFNLEAGIPGAFTERDERILSSFAERAARAVEQAELYNQAQEAAARESLISRITCLLNQSLDSQSMFQQMVEELGAHLKANRCFMVHVDSRTGVIDVAHQYAHECPSLTAGFDLLDFQTIHDAIGRGPVVSTDVMTDRAMEGLREQFVAYGTRGFLAVPVSDRGPHRIVIVCTALRPRVWRTEEVDLVRALAAQAAIARERAELFQAVTSGQIEWERTFNAMPEAVFVFDKDRSLSRANLAAVALKAPEGVTLAGQNCCEVIRWSFGLNECLIEQAIQSQETIVREITPPKIARPFLITVEPLFRSNGANSGAIVIARDLTDIRRAQAEAQEQKQFLSQLLEIAHDAIFVLDREGRISWSNLRLSELSGHRPEELRELRLPELITTVAQIGGNGLSHPEQGKLPESFEAQLTCKDGSRRYVLATSSPIYESSQLSGALGILHDITDVRVAGEKAAQAEKLRALGQLAGGVAHNFNNLLAAILGHTQLLKRTFENSPAADRLEIIERAAMDGAAMVRRINSFSLQQIDERFEPLDVNQLVRDSLEITRTRWEDDARARGITYTIDFRASEMPAVLGLASELREVFVNIIINAVDAMAPQGGRLFINTGSNPGGVFARFSDEGHGMTAEVKARVFEPFFTTKGVGGTGLGLSASYAIVERHGGRIEVESERGQGSAFTIWLAVTNPDGPRSTEQCSRPSTSLKLLVVDDDEPVRQALAELLEAHGHSVTPAESGSSALAALNTESSCYAAAFIDLAMPEMDGLAVARAVRALRKAQVKVLLITGYADAAVLSEEEKTLVDAIIPKPFQEETILTALEGVLSRKS